MKYIEVNGIKCHWNFKLLPKKFWAITLFGHIFFRCDYNALKTHLNSIGGKITINHERIHMLQAKGFKTKYFGFYAFYIWYWVRNLFKYGIKDSVAYYNIPFEKEAYANEKDFSYSETKWKEYK